MVVTAGLKNADIRPILAAIETVPIPVHPAATEVRKTHPFVTISRQVGVGAWTLAKRLVQRLNEGDPQAHTWTCWDRELVEKIAADTHLSRQLVESLEESSHGWLNEFFSGLVTSEPEDASELAVFERVASTIRALAQAGRTVIVGRGSAYLTRNMPGGIHVRLVAPFEYRVNNMQNQLGVSRVAAIARVRELERNREAFHKRYFSRELMQPEQFVLQINTGEVSERLAVELIALVVTEQTR